MYVVIRSYLVHRDRFDNFSMFFKDRGSEDSQDFSEETSRKDRSLFQGFDGFGGGTNGYANSCQTAVLVLSSAGIADVALSLMEISLVINWVCLTCIIPLWRDVFTIYSEADSVERASIVQRSLQGSSPLVRTFHAHIIWVQPVASSHTMFSKADIVERASIVQRSLQGSSPLIRTFHAHIIWAQQVASSHTIFSKADSVERASVVQRSLQGSSPLVRTFHKNSDEQAQCGCKFFFNMSILCGRRVLTAIQYFSKVDSVETASIVQRSLKVRRL